MKYFVPLDCINVSSSSDCLDDSSISNVFWGPVSDFEAKLHEQFNTGFNTVILPSKHLVLPALSPIPFATDFFHDNQSKCNQNNFLCLFLAHFETK
jgi:hypothetical protein